MPELQFFVLFLINNLGNPCPLTCLKPRIPLTMYCSWLTLSRNKD